MHVPDKDCQMNIHDTARRPSIDIGTLTGRVKSLLLSPKSEWPMIAAEPATTKGLYAGYIMILAAIPAVSGFIKGSLIGHSMFGVTVTTPVMAGLMVMIAGYVLSLVLLFVIALIINALATNFGGQKDQVQALKTAGYAWTAAWVASVAAIIPWLGWLIMLAGGLYSIYLLYLGLPHTMKCPPEKAAGYTAVSVILAIVLSWVVTLVVAGIAGTGALTSAAIRGDTTPRNANVTFDQDSQLGRLAALSERLQAAGEQSQQASRSGQSAAADAQARQMQAGDDPQAQAQAAMSAMMGAMMGRADGATVESLTPDQLKTFLPGSLGGFERESISASRQAGMDMQITEASAVYANADRNYRVSVNLTDAAAMAGMMAMAGAFGAESESQTADGYEKTYIRDGHRIHEQWNQRSQRGEYSIIVGDRFQVEVSGKVESIDQLKGMVGSIDLAGLAALENAGVQKQ